MRLTRYQQKMLRQPPGPIVREGIYKFKNNTRGELHLARPTASGVRKVGKDQEFQGDSYYLQMLKTGELKLVEVIQLPPKKDQPLNESNMENTNMSNDKLILEQPPMVTDAGKVEFVVPKPNQKKLHENKPVSPQDDPDILLNENPLDGIELI